MMGMCPFLQLLLSLSSSFSLPATTSMIVLQVGSRLMLHNATAQQQPRAQAIEEPVFRSLLFLTSALIM